MKKILAALLLTACNAFAASSNNLHYGASYPLDQGGNSATTTTLSAANNGACAVQMLDQDASTVAITHLGYQQTAISGTPTIKVSLQSVDTSGNPSGTILGGGSPASHQFTASGTGWQWVALDNAYTGNRGDLVALCVYFVSGVTSITMDYRSVEVGSEGGVPYALTTADASAFTKFARTPTLALKNTDASIVIGRPHTGVTALGGVVQAIGATAEAGFGFKVPATVCNTYTVKGVRWTGKSPTGSTTNTYQARLYTTPTGTPSAAQSITALVNNVEGVSATSGLVFELYFAGTLTTLSGGTQYAIGISTTTASNMDLNLVQVDTVTDFNAFPYQQRTSLMTRTVAAYPPAGDTTTFTETTTKRPLGEIIVGDCSAAASGGGGGVY